MFLLNKTHLKHLVAICYCDMYEYRCVEYNSYPSIFDLVGEVNILWEVVGGLVVKALDCGVRGHRFESHLLLPREGF